MNNIPPKLRRELAKDPYYKTCCITGIPGKRGDQIEFHHNLIHGGKQYQSRFAILPVRKSIHAMASNPAVKERMDWVMLNRANSEELRAISKAIDYVRRRDYLNQKFGTYQQDIPSIVPKCEIAYPWLTEKEV